MIPTLLFSIGAALPAPCVDEPHVSVRVPEGGTSVSFAGERPTVECTVGGQPLKLLVDTGSTVPLLLTSTARGRLHEASGDARASRSVVPELHLGAAVFEDVPVAGFDFHEGLGVDGVLGLPCFAECLLTFDFPRRTLRVDAGALEEGPGVVPFARDEEMGFGIVVDLDVAGVRVPAHLDTGSPGLAMFSSLVRPELALRGEPRLAGRARTPMGDADVYAAELDGTLRLGPLAFENPELRFADLPQIAGRRLGNVGGGMLGEAAITIDQAHGRMRIERAERRPEAVTAKPARRLGVALALDGADGARMTIDSIVPGSAAERAGLAVHDRLVEIDGAPATGEALRSALAGDAAIVLVVERAGERRTVTVFGNQADGV